MRLFSQTFLALAACLLLAFGAQAQSSIFYDFVCDSSDCAGAGPLEGFWELSDTGVVADQRLGLNAGEIRDFHFAIGPQIFSLSDFSEPFVDKVILISTDGSFLTAVYQGVPGNVISFSKLDGFNKIAEIIISNQLTAADRKIICIRADCGAVQNISVPGRWVKRVSTKEVSIDIKPGSDPNCFNINGNGVIPVAILGSNTFDVLAIDTSALFFAGLEVRMRVKKGPMCHGEDFNGDEFLDLVCQFQDDASMWAPDSASEATLAGTLLDGTTEFEATDSICVTQEVEEVCPDGGVPPCPS